MSTGRTTVSSVHGGGGGVHVALGTPENTKVLDGPFMAALERSNSNIRHAW